MMGTNRLSKRTTQGMGVGTANGPYNEPNQYGYPAGAMQGDGYGYDNNPYPSVGGSGSSFGSGGTGNDKGWSTGIQDAFYGVQDDPYKGKLRDRIAKYQRYGSVDAYDGFGGMPGAYAP